MPGTELTRALARALLDRLPCQVDRGMTQVELDGVETRYGIRFAADHRVLLGAGVPVGAGWPNWRDADHGDLRGRLDWPVQGVLFDVEHNGFWHGGWGRPPEAVGERVRIARAELTGVPQLIPVFGHRYLPGIAGQVGHPVLSVYETDIIYYGADLADYLRREWLGYDAEDDRDRGACSNVPFWTGIVEGEDDDPYFVQQARADAEAERRVHPPVRVPPRALSEHERAVLALLLAAAGPGTEALVAQLDQTRVVAQWAQGSASVDLTVDDDVPRAPQYAGLLPITANVVDESDQQVGELLVWISAAGTLAALEYAWIGDESPTALPRLERIQLPNRA